LPAANAQQPIIVHANTTQHPKEPNTLRKPKTGLDFLGSGESAIKLNLSSVFRADYCIGYEKKLSRFFSAELTAGFTRYDRLTEALDFFTYKPENMVRAKRQFNMAPSVKLGGRYYFETGADEISGPYISVEGMYRRYGYRLKNTYTTPSLAKEHSDQKEIRVLYGWQDSDFRDVAFYDCSVGLGYRSHERSYLGYGDMYNRSTQQILKGSKNYLVFVISIKVGYMFR
jgi:hypothetical protein